VLLRIVQRSREASAICRRGEARDRRCGLERIRPEDLTPIGIEAAFAKSFVERYGEETAPAIAAFCSEICKRASEAGQRNRSFLGGPILEDLGIKYPFVQGAMTWISDSLPFARAVSDAGALPTLALGVYDDTALEERLAGLDEVLAGRPYAVNIVGLAENPALEAQLRWIRKHRPPFVALAAGLLPWPDESERRSGPLMEAARSSTSPRAMNWSGSPSPTASGMSYAKERGRWAHWAAHNADLCSDRH